MSIFHNIAPNFTLLQKTVIFQVYLQLFRQLLHPYKFHGMDMSGILFFIFASCELLPVENRNKKCGKQNKTKQN